jgi:hypothetical protein
VVLNCDHEQNLNVPVLLRGLQSLMNKKWSSRSRNKNLFVVAVSIMLFAEEEYPETYREVRLHLFKNYLGNKRPAVL